MKAPRLKQVDREAVRAACAADDSAEARSVIDRFLAGSSTAASIEFAARQAGEMAERIELPEFRLALVTSFTSSLLEPHLRLSTFRQGRRLVFTSIDYDQWYGALREEGELDAFGPDAVFVLQQLEDMLPGLARRHIVDMDKVGGETEGLVAGLDEALQGFRERNQAPVIVANFIAAQRQVERHFDENSAISRYGMVEALNNQLRDMVRGHRNIWILDYAGKVTDYGREHWFDPVKSDHVGVPFTQGAFMALANEISGFIEAMLSPRKKVLVLDLDNTLWGGIVGEDGPQGIAVSGGYPGNAYRNFQDFLVNLRATGIALAIASKNNESDAREAFNLNPDMPLRWDDFSAHKISWQDKPNALREIAGELNLGLDSFVFADDNLFECDMMREVLPEVTVVNLDGSPSLFPKRIVEGAHFHTITLTAEDRIRADAYAAERKRTSDRCEAGDIGSFLSRLKLELSYRNPRPDEIDRVIQLFNKTNQFNLTVRRYQHADIQKILDGEQTKLRVASLKDCYGDYGLIGLVVTRDAVDHGEREIDSLLLSCRALGRNVEDALLAEIEADARAFGCKRLVGGYMPANKNAQVKDFFTQRGFVVGKHKGSFIRDLEATEQLSYPEHIKVIRES